MTTPEELEKIWLPRLEEQDRNLMDIAKKWARSYKNSQQILQMAINIQKWERYFIETFEPMAQYLENAGKPKMLIRLNNILGEISKTMQICQQMYQSAYNFENGLIQTNIETQNKIFDIWQRINQRR